MKGKEWLEKYARRPIREDLVLVKDYPDIAKEIKNYLERKDKADKTIEEAEEAMLQARVNAYRVGISPEEMDRREEKYMRSLKNMAWCKVYVLESEPTEPLPPLYGADSITLIVPPEFYHSVVCIDEGHNKIIYIGGEQREPKQVYTPKKIREIAEIHKKIIAEEKMRQKREEDEYERKMRELDDKMKQWVAYYTRPARKEHWVEFLAKTPHRVTHHYDYRFPSDEFRIVVRQPKEPLPCAYGASSKSIIVPPGSR